MPHDLPPIAYRIEPETPEDVPAAEALIAESFGPERSKRTVYRLREGRAPIPDLAFVARAEMARTGGEELVASLNFWEVDAAGRCSARSPCWRNCAGAASAGRWSATG
jgi:predicted N-acetyltransferase YhbS